uniref:Uncharacterized protein n=1 Tax=Leersia perrieri TaxID=77586 RepID=A0A0D9WKP4_9ORYZ
MEPSAAGQRKKEDLEATPLTPLASKLAMAAASEPAMSICIQLEVLLHTGHPAGGGRQKHRGNR